jgi:hypothetical protein
MALYKVTQERLLVPYFYHASTGAPASPADLNAHRQDRATSPLAVDERGNPKSEVQTLVEGDLFYTAEGDLSGLDEEQAESAFFVSDENVAQRYTKKSEAAVEEGRPAIVESVDAGEEQPAAPARAPKVATRSPRNKNVAVSPDEDNE